MKKITSSLVRMAFPVALAVATLPALSRAATMNDYCVSPAFIQQTVPANLLLMIDNSASMYDLAYVDKGYKTCSTTTSTYCSYDTNCPSGETCSRFVREPYYCYDETYKSATTYTGYFVPTTYYYYRAASDDFAPVASAFPSGCGTGSGTTTKTIASTMCLEYSTSGTTKTLVSFVAKGNYLNWVTASKFDVEKQILTGGLVTGSNLTPQSRGCVGQGYVKQALAGDFVNYPSSSTDPNTKATVTFTVRGPAGSTASAPSPGGQTYIDLFSSNTPYNFAACQDAVNALATGTNADIKQSVGACLAQAAPATGYCQQLTSKSCTTSSDCVRNASASQSVSVCTGNTNQQCTSDTNCQVASRSACSLDATRSCTTDTNCTVTTAEVLGTCSTLSTNYTPSLGSGDKNSIPATCRSDANCNFSHGNTSFTAKAGACIGYVAATSTSYGTCQTTPASDWRPCVPNYVGACVLPGTTVATKTKVSFQQSMQACWALRNGHNIGVDDINTVTNQCSDVYGGYYSCSNNASQTCTGTSDTTTCGAGTCVGGPPAIAPGNPALLCGSSYEGTFYTWNGTAWVLMSSLPGTLTSGMTNAGCISADSLLTCMEKVHTKFCNDMSTPSVTDPTDAPSDTATYDNLPAIISGIGVEAQLGQPVKSMRVQVQETPVQGLVQEFGPQIRIGVMSFNYSGDAYELSSGAMTVARVCSNDPSKHCTADSDCPSSLAGSCGNLDGGSIIYDVGKGKCGDAATKVIASPTVVCTTDNNCGSGKVCVTDAVGDHATAGTLVYSLDRIQANTWTPFAEAFYSAIGYYASRKVCDNDATRYCTVDGDCATGHKCNAVTGTSRTDLRLNGSDFVPQYYPSQYTCQKNYILLVSDGMSTADRHSTVSSLATAYSTAQTGQGPYAAATCSNYAGSTYLETLAWLAQHRNIDTLRTDPTNPSTDTWTKGREHVTTYVVFNGENSGTAGDCNSYNLLNNTATAGGTAMETASDPAALSAALRKVFSEVAAQTSSGTAASILSNSEGSGANILQAIFYPQKSFDNGTTNVQWIGEMQNLWYYVDPFIGNSTMREDSDYSAANLAANDPHYFNLRTDKVTKFNFNDATSQTQVDLWQDTDGNGSPDVYLATETPEDVKSLWRAGKQLWNRTSARAIYTQNGSGLVDIGSLDTTTTAVQNLLQAANQKFCNNDATRSCTLDADCVSPGLCKMEGYNIISYVKGGDVPGYRGRSVVIPSVDAVSRVWKLGDIVSSTPKVQSSVRQNYYDLPSPGGYSDKSYGAFLTTTSYQNRGMAYVGANDGMLHAFKQGKLNVAASGDLKATLTGTDLGEEQWGFIPKNALPYLKYLTDPNYTHLFFVEGETTIADVSIVNPAGCSGDYWDCIKDVPGVPAGNPGGTNWATVLLGSMGIGGASRNTGTSCNGGTSDCVNTPIDGVGYSSYFALDITNQSFNPSTGVLAGPPTFLWEFTDPQLGYATSGAAIVKVSSLTAGVSDQAKNGHWYAVLASGPTGPIDGNARQFKGKSDQNLRLFILDLKSGTLLRTIDTGIANAYGGRITNSVIDADRNGPKTNGFYQDDAVYIGYVKKAGDGTWTDGGVLRLMTKEDPNPNQWQWSTVIDGVGAVTTNIAKIQDTKNQNLWLYFGTGRYSYSQDDMGSNRRIYAIKEPCYTTSNTLDKNCSAPPIGVTSNLCDKTTDLADSLSCPLTTLSPKGWYISLEAQNTPVAGFGAERVLTDPVTMTSGAVFFQTFKPTADPCQFGGNSYMWAVKYDTGAAPPSGAIQAKALIQLSTGSFKEMNLGTDLTQEGGRRSDAMTGFTSTTAAPIVSKSGLKPVKKIMHILEH
jgi:type IV pilus assembly protein PilY1